MKLENMSYEIVFNLLLTAIGIFILIRSGTYVVRSLVKIAHFLNISEFTISFILMAFATTLPEFGIGIGAALSGKPLVSLGNVFGSNILNLSLILGIVVLIAGKIEINYSGVHKGWSNFFLAVSPVLFLIDLKLSRVEGFFLVFIFLLHLARILHLKEIIHHKREFWHSFINYFNHRCDGLDIKFFFKNLGIFVLSVSALLFSATLIVKGVENISLNIGISQILLSIFIVAFGTSLPELFFSVKTALSRNEGLSLGDLYGASVFNSTWILGVTAFISPIQINETSSYYISAATMVLVLFLANLFLWTFKRINRREGVILILIYFIFFIFQIIY